MCELWEKVKNVFNKKCDHPGLNPVPVFHGTSGTSGMSGSSGWAGKYALIVGINKYATPGNDLSGCVNDAMNMRELLINKFRFPADNIRMLTDERATIENIIDRLYWLISQRGELVYHHSGHGTQMRDRNGDELNDGLDEVLVTYDHDWDNPLSDDLIANMFGRKSPESYLTMICDTCHSGTMNRGYSTQYGASKGTPKFLAPPVDIASRSAGRAFRHNRFRNRKYIAKENILLSGCKDNQSSMDAYIDGTFQGVMTASFIKSMERFVRPTWKELHTTMVEIVNKWDFTQDPQLTGSEELKSRPVFGG